MGDVNKVILIGNVGKDPEVRSMQSGDEVAQLSIATSKRFTSNGQRKEVTEWHRVVVFDPQLVKVVKEYVQKGTRLYVEGELKTRSWENNQGAKQYATEVVLAKFNGKLDIQARGKEKASASDGGGQQSGSDDLDDDIPF